MEKTSHKSNAQCAKDIGEAINSHFDGFHYHTGFEKELIETYGESNMLLLITSGKSFTMEESAKKIRPGHYRARGTKVKITPNRNIRSIPTAVCWIYLLTTSENNSLLMKQKKT